MNHIKSLFAVACTLLMLFGCEKPNDPAAQESNSGLTASNKSSSPEDLKGVWKAKLDMKSSNSSAKGDGFEKVAEGMGEAMMAMMAFELEFPTNETFKMTAMGIPVEGKVQRSGNKLTMTPEKIMGMTKEDAKKMSKNPIDDKPIIATVSEDGKSITMMPEDKGGESVVFERSNEKTAGPKEVVDKIKTEDDRRLVGEWKGSFEAPPLTGKESKEELSEIEMMKGMSDSFKLNLKPDYTFEMNVVMQLNGEWKRSGNKVVLNPTGFGGMKMPEGGKSSGDPLECVLMSGDSEIVLKGKDDKEGLVRFTKR